LLGITRVEIEKVFDEKENKVLEYSATHKACYENVGATPLVRASTPVLRPNFFQYCYNFRLIFNLLGNLLDVLSLNNGLVLTRKDV